VICKLKKKKIKVYLYTRVSTTMQIDGYFLDAQKTKMKAFCDYNEYEIAGEYEDAGKSGKSIEGRVSFNQMMEDIKSGKDGVSYAQMNESEKREFLSQLMDNVQIYEERKENGQWMKSIEFKLSIIEKEFTLF